MQDFGKVQTSVKSSYADVAKKIEESSIELGKNLENKTNDNRNSLNFQTRHLESEGSDEARAWLNKKT